MKNLLFIALASLVVLTSCNQNPNYQPQGQTLVQPAQNVVVQPTISNLGDNLNLQALGEMVRTSTSASDIEQKLNQPSSINNLDLDNDGNVDFISVTEYGQSPNIGFSFTANLTNGDKQEVCTIEVQQGGNNQANLVINGNQTLYGSNAYYSSGYSMTDLMIWHYLFYPHSYYHSMWHYGYYPSYYHSYRCSPYSTYNNNMRTRVSTTKITRTTTTTNVSKIKSPNSNLSSKVVNTRAESLAAPTKSQKQFKVTTPENKRPDVSGFKRTSTSNPTYNKPAYVAPKPTPSRSIFGNSSKNSSSSNRGSSGRRK